MDMFFQSTYISIDSKFKQCTLQVAILGDFIATGTGLIGILVPETESSCSLTSSELQIILIKVVCIPFLAILFSSFLPLSDCLVAQHPLLPSLFSLLKSYRSEALLPIFQTSFSCFKIYW
ncbi:hypothetical protein Tco_0563892 [Tanacetum coccineum]